MLRKRETCKACFLPKSWNGLAVRVVGRLWSQAAWLRLARRELRERERQQPASAEKALKALYIERRGVLAPRTHDLVFLGGELGVPVAIDTDLAHLDTVFNQVRYPDSVDGRAPVDEVTDAEATLDLAAAERVLEWIRSELKV